MGDINNIEKTCAFYVSDTHLTAMIIPYINREIEKNNIIETFLEFNLQENIKLILDKIILNEKTKNKIAAINWYSHKILKYSEIEEKIKKITNNTSVNQINILINGDEKYIKNANNILEKILKQNIKIINKKIRIIDCYSVDLIDDNIKEIVESHDTILNTAGIKKIEEVFEKYDNKSNIETV